LFRVAANVLQLRDASLRDSENSAGIV